MAYNRLVCLVGTNPLPIYLSILQFIEPNGTVVMVHTQETGAVAGRIQTEVIKVLPQVKFLLQPLENRSDPSKIRGVIEKVYGTGDAALNYTGGTKAMAAYSVAKWERQPGKALYLDDSAGLYYFDDPGGRTENACIDSNRAPTAQVICALHGANAPSAQESIPLAPLGNEPDPAAPETVTTDFLKALLNLTIQYGLWSSTVSSSNSPDQAYKLYEVNKDNLIAILREVAVSPAPEWVRLIETNLTPGNYEDSPQQRIYDYIVDGGWLEDCVSLAMLSIPEDPETEYQFGTLPGNPLLKLTQVMVRQQFEIESQKFRSGVTAVLGSAVRYCLISGTADKRACQAMMFEARYRSQQIGGDLAASCMISVLGDDEVQECRDALKQTSHTAFGIRDLKEWIIDESPDSLRQFLNTR